MDKWCNSFSVDNFSGVCIHRFSAERSLEKTLNSGRRAVDMMKNTTPKKRGDAEARSASKIDSGFLSGFFAANHRVSARASDKNHGASGMATESQNCAKSRNETPSVMMFRKTSTGLSERNLAVRRRWRILSRVF